MGIIRAVVIQIVEALGVAFVLAWAMCRCPSFTLAPRAHLILVFAPAPVLFQIVLVFARPPTAKALEQVNLLSFLGV